MKKKILRNIIQALLSSAPTMARNGKSAISNWKKIIRYYLDRYNRLPTSRVIILYFLVSKFSPTATTSSRITEFYPTMNDKLFEGQ